MNSFSTSIYQEFGSDELKTNQFKIKVNLIICMNIYLKFTNYNLHLINDD